MNDGQILIDSNEAKEFGFTADKFTKSSYLWKTNNRIWISFIESREKNRGNLKGLFRAIWSKGYEIAVPTPFALMRFILQKYGFKQTYERIEEEDCEVYIRGLERDVQQAAENLSAATRDAPRKVG